MIELPRSTNVYQQMPKEIFFKYLNDSRTLKKMFIDEIESIIWMNKLSPETITISQGKIITEIAVVEIVLKRQAISQNLLEIISKEIDQYTIFITRNEEWGQIWCCNNEFNNNTEAYLKVNTYYQTNWLLYDDLVLKVEGQNLDQVYENFLMQITGKPIQVENGNRQTDNVEKAEELEELEELEVVIKKLETQIDHEKQFKRQLNLVIDLKNAKEELKKIKTPRMTLTEIFQTKKMDMPQNNIENIRSFFPNVFLNMKDGTGSQFDYTLF